MLTREQQEQGFNHAAITAALTVLMVTIYVFLWVATPVMQRNPVFAHLMTAAVSASLTSWCRYYQYQRKLNK